MSQGRFRDPGLGFGVSRLGFWLVGFGFWGLGSRFHECSAGAYGIL